MNDAISSGRRTAPMVATNTSEVTIGSFLGFDDAGRHLVDWPNNPLGHPQPALTIASLKGEDVGRAIALLFSGGDPCQPVIIGSVRMPIDDVLEATDQEHSVKREIELEADTVPIAENSLEAKVDGERLVLSAEKEVAIECGDASITLTRAGKVIVRGKYVLSRSSGVNRIKGGSVQLN